MLLSVIMPFYNEASSIREAVNRCLELPLSDELDIEIIAVDNCSVDGSAEIVREMCAEDSRVKLIRFSRNFGPMVDPSIHAGLSFCQGDLAVIVYSDMQDPPETIPAFIEAISSGYDVAYGVRRSRRGDSFLFRIAARAFYFAFSRVSASPTYGNTGDFIMITRRVLDSLLSLPEGERFTRGLIPWLGYKAVQVPYDRVGRTQGRSKSNWYLALNAAIHGFVSFSRAPLRFLLLFGFSVGLISMIALAWQLGVWMSGQAVPGLPTLISLGFLNLGVITFVISVVGEYVGTIFSEVKKRPPYIIDETLGFRASSPSPK